MKAYIPSISIVILILFFMSYQFFPTLFPYPVAKTIIATSTLPNMKSKLSPKAYYVMYQAGTEAPYSSPLLDEHRKGTFVSADTGLPLFRSEDKYDSGTGWPSFVKPISPEAIILNVDNTLGETRTEVLTGDTHAHLGHVFEDGPSERGGKRYCMNGVALVFIPD